MAKKRFKEDVNIRQTDLGTGMPEATMSLVQKLDQFDSQLQQFAGAGFELRAENEAQAGAEEAEAEIASQLKKTGKVTPKEKELGIFNRHRARAYNKALGDAYAASFFTDNSEALNRIYTENSSNTIGWNDASKAHIQGALKGADPAAKGQFALELKKMASYFQKKVETNQYERQRGEAFSVMKKGVETTSRGSAKAAREGNRDASRDLLLKANSYIDSMQTSGFISEDKAADYKREAEREATEQSKRYGLDILSVDEAEAELKKMTNKVEKGWTPDEWDTFIDSARIDLGHRREVERGAIAAEYEKIEGELLVKLVARELTVPEIMATKLPTKTKRLWIGELNQTTDRSISAAAAKKAASRRAITEQRTDRAYLKTQVQTGAEEAVQELYEHGRLTPTAVTESDARPEIKRLYLKRLKEDLQMFKDKAIEDNKQMLGVEIVNNLGNWTDPELLAFLPRGLNAREVLFWQEKNATAKKEAKADPSYFRKNPIYKASSENLDKDKKNALFIGGTGKLGDTEWEILRNNSVNTDRFLAVKREFERRSAEPGAKPDEIYKELTRPFLEDVAKTAWENFRLFTEEDLRAKEDKLKNTPKAEQAKTEKLPAQPPTFDVWYEGIKKRTEGKFTMQQMKAFWETEIKPKGNK